MNVTDEMVAAFYDQLAGGYTYPEEMKAGLRAVLAIIDPVPELVSEVVDSDGDRWRRTVDPLVWARGHQKHSIGFIAKLYGPITWEGKAG